MNFNDMAESIRIPTGWSVRLFRDAGYSGPNTCVTSSDEDLWDDSFDDGTTVADNATSMEVYDQPSCPPPRPDKPTDLAIIDATDSTLRLEWSDHADNEDGFNVYRWGHDGTQWAFLYLDSVGANQTSFVDSGLDSGKDYFYAVSAYNSSGESVMTDWVSGKTLRPETYRLYLPLTLSAYAPPLVFRSLEEDGEVGRLSCQDWASCRNAAYGSFVWSDFAYSSVNADYGVDDYVIKRTFLRFDTSVLPENARIDSAILHVYSGSGQAGRTGVHLVNSDQGESLSTGDFDSVGFQSGGSADFLPGAWVEIPLNAAGKTWIERGGVTELALIHDLDLRNIAPTEENSASLALHENGELAPYLSIRYAP
jgi:hypothetical protein